mmetsp:Transcript_29811/g.35150  ORF Transcript_29811/g.35150 Transcript_29811/m.35150 type:complete len:380 (+) Transcript_29811:310-1449(+)
MFSTTNRFPSIKINIYFKRRLSRVCFSMAIYVHNWSFGACLELLVACRPSVRPNEGFRRQLESWILKYKTCPDSHITIMKQSIMSINDRQKNKRKVKDIDKEKEKELRIEYKQDYSRDNKNDDDNKNNETAEVADTPSPSPFSPSSSFAVLVLPGSFNPVHKGHLECLEIAKAHLQAQGVSVIGGFLQPSSDSYVSQKLGAEAMSFNERVEVCFLAIKEHHQSYGGKKEREYLDKEDRCDIETSDWISVWASGETNGVNACNKCATYIGDCLNTAVQAYLVCGGDLAQNLGWGRQFELPCPVVVIGREGVDNPDADDNTLPSDNTSLPSGWCLASNGKVVNTSNSTAVRKAFKTNNEIELKLMLHDSVLEYMTTTQKYT